MIIVKTRTLGLAAALAIFGGIALSSLLGFWNTSSTKVPAKIAAGEFAGLPNPSDIRGSYTWAEVAAAFGLPLESVLAAFGAKDSGDKVNSLEALYEGRLPPDREIGTDSVRLFVALYTGLPHEAEEGTVLPSSAIPILRAEAKAEASRIDAAAARAVTVAASAELAMPPPASSAPAPAAPAPAAPAAPAPAAPAQAAKTSAAVSPAAAPPAPAAAPSATAAGTTATEEHAPAAGAITGKTSFNDLKTWGFDMDRVEALLGGLGPSAQAVKDYCAAKGLSFSELKPKLQELAP